MPYVQKSERLDGMHVDWNVPIRTRDGSCLYADVYRPVKAGQYPVILSHGPYGKGLSFQEGYRTAWDIMAEKHPDVTAGSTNKYQNWKSSTLKSGCLMTTPWYESIRGAQGLHPDSWLCGVRKKPKTCTIAFNGLVSKHGPTAKSDSTASLTMA